MICLIEFMQRNTIFLNFTEAYFVVLMSDLTIMINKNSITEALSSTGLFNKVIDLIYK